MPYHWPGSSRVMCAYPSCTDCWVTFSSRRIAGVPAWWRCCLTWAAWNRSDFLSLTSKPRSATWRNAHRNQLTNDNFVNRNMKHDNLSLIGRCLYKAVDLLPTIFLMFYCSASPIALAAQHRFVIINLHVLHEGMLAQMKTSIRNFIRCANL